MLTNADISELLALESDHSKMPTKKALRRASRRALLWPEEAPQLLQEGRSLQELSAVGPYLEKVIARWINDPPDVPERPEIRREFLTLTEARLILKNKPAWMAGIKGDLQMHTTWSDGEGSIEEMAEAAIERGYQYIAITDHSKGLKIAGGINEEQLRQQGREIRAINEKLGGFQVLRSVELNLNPAGEVDMDSDCLRELDLVLGCFHSALRKKEEQTERYIAALRNPEVHILGHPRGRIYNYRLGLSADWSVCLALQQSWIKPSKSMAIQIGRTSAFHSCRLQSGVAAASRWERIRMAHRSCGSWSIQQPRHWSLASSETASSISLAAMSYLPGLELTANERNRTPPNSKQSHIKICRTNKCGEPEPTAFLFYLRVVVA
jgi:hypothetical protein